MLGESMVAPKLEFSYRKIKDNKNNDLWLSNNFPKMYYCSFSYLDTKTMFELKEISNNINLFLCFDSNNELKDESVLINASYINKYWRCSSERLYRYLSFNLGRLVGYEIENTPPLTELFPDN